MYSVVASLVPRRPSVESEVGRELEAYTLALAVESPTASSREFICNVTSYVGGIGQKVGEDGCAQKVGNGDSLEQGT